MEPSGIRIPPDQLTPQTLRNVIEEFVTRDGTELSEAEAKIEEVLILLERGAVELWFDETTHTTNVVVAHPD